LIISLDTAKKRLHCSNIVSGEACNKNSNTINLIARRQLRLLQTSVSKTCKKRKIKCFAKIGGANKSKVLPEQTKNLVFAYPDAAQSGSEFTRFLFAVRNAQKAVIHTKTYFHLKGID